MTEPQPPTPVARDASAEGSAEHELRCSDPDKACVACEPKKKRWRDHWPRPVRWVANHAYPMPCDPPESFPQCLHELRRRLETKDDALASELLADAESLNTEVEMRIQGVQQRATTLQGAVAIAAAVALSGGGLILDKTKVSEHDWRVVFAVGLGLLVALLTISAFRALGASSRAFVFLTPSDEDIFQRAKLSAAAAKSWRAAYLLQVYGHNNEVAALKVGYLKEAARWLRAALGVLVVLMALLAAYVACQ